MKILITGVAGFIGSRLARFLLKKNYVVYGVDNLWKGEIKNIPVNVNFIKGDIGDIKTIQKVKEIESIDVICHLAGQSSGEKSFYDPKLDLKLNLSSTLGIVEIAKFFSVEKIINASSMSVYGSLDSAANEEKNTPMPLSIYGQNKLSSERFLSILLPNISVLNYRMFNVYGPGQCLKDLKQGMVSIFLSMAINQSKIEIKGSLNRIRDFIYIDDVILFWYKAIKLELNSHKIINLGTGKATKVSTLVEIIKKNFSNNIDVEVLDPTPCDQSIIYSNNNSLIKLFGDFEFINIEDGIRLFIENTKQHDDHLRL